MKLKIGMRKKKKTTTTKCWIRMILQDIPRQTQSVAQNEGR